MTLDFSSLQPAVFRRWKKLLSERNLNSAGSRLEKRKDVVNAHCLYAVKLF